MSYSGTTVHMPKLPVRPGNEIPKWYKKIINTLVDQGWEYRKPLHGNKGRLIPPNPDMPYVGVSSTPQYLSNNAIWISALQRSGAQIDKDGNSTVIEAPRTVVPLFSDTDMVAVETDLLAVSTRGAWWRPQEPEPEPEPAPPVVERPRAPVRQGLDPKAEGSAYSLAQARSMLRQGYHVNKVIARTGWGRDWFSDLVDPTGFYAVEA